MMHPADNEQPRTHLEHATDDVDIDIWTNVAEADWEDES